MLGQSFYRYVNQARLQHLLDNKTKPVGSLAETVPVIDIEQSISRAMVNLIDTPHLDQIRKFKVLFARYQRSRDLISVGAYAPGSDQVLDQAITLYPQMESFLQQQLIEQSNFPSSLEALKALI